MGVTGTGKTTVGRLLARTLGWPFHDADDFHSQASIAKMRSGEPLTDADRAPWLAALARLMGDLLEAQRSAVLACSALTGAHREVLRSGRPGVVFVHLRGAPGLLAERLRERRGHFMPARLLASQLDTLEPPADALTVDVAGPPDAIAAEIARRLGLTAAAS